MSGAGGSGRVRFEGVVGLGTVAQVLHLLAVGRRRADFLTCQRVVRALAAGRGLDLGGEAAVA
jgi:hypothetical protein